MSATQTGKRILTFAVAALFAGAVAMAQQQPNSPQNQPNQQNQPPMPGQQSPGNPNYPQAGTPGMDQSMSESFAEQSFVRKVLETSAEEARMSEIAEQKSPSPDVKQFGQKMVLIHNQLEGQFSPIAKTLDVEPVQKLDKKQKRAIDQLNALSGPSFDTAYIKAMAKDQKNVVKEFKNEANNSQSPTLKQVAQMDGPVYQQHLQVLEQIAQNHNVTIAEK